MNENIQLESNNSSGKINPLLIVGIVAVIGLLGFYMIRTNAQQSAKMDAGAESQDASMVAPDSTAIDTAPEEEVMDPATGTTPGTTDPATSEMVDGDVQVVSIEGGSFYYKPDEIRVKKGQTVRVEMKSADMMHDFVIDELGVKMPVVTAGNTGTVEFVADTVGEFEFYCSVGQHRKNGQVGTLIVEE